MSQEPAQPRVIWADKHRIRRCDETTGHTVVTIAMCENSSIAQWIAEAITEKLARS